MQTAAYVVSVYAVLVAVGGVIGYVKAKSLPSLMAGSVSFLLLLAAAYAMRTGQSWGLPLALALALFLQVFFSLRFVKTRAFMPSGLMAILSLLALVGILLTKK